MKQASERFRARLVRPEVEKKLNSLVHYHSYDQLFYDVANFVVYNQIPGDYLELGVYRGDSLATMYHYLLLQWRTYEEHAWRFNHDYDRTYWERKRFIAFDSFEGLPATNGDETPGHYSPGTYRTSLEECMANVVKKGVDRSKVIVFPGWFDQTLTSDLAEKNEISQACAIYIDCDLYESAALALNFIAGFVQDGTVVILDDFFRYKGHPRKGVQGAFNEWLERSPDMSVRELARCGANRVAFMCNVRNPAPER